MIEPTETEAPETLDNFIDAMISIAREAQENAELVNTAPHSTPVRRLDEAGAARRLVLKWDENRNPTDAWQYPWCEHRVSAGGDP